MSSGKNNNFALSTILLAILVAGAGYYLYEQGKLNFGKKFSSENVSVSKLDLAKAPAGLPVDLPMDKANIAQSNTLDYPDRGVTLYSISYRSGNQLEGLYNVYKNYLRSHGYTISTDSKSPALMTLVGKKDPNTLSVNISANTDGSNLVNIGYLYKK